MILVSTVVSVGNVMRPLAHAFTPEGMLTPQQNAAARGFLRSSLRSGCGERVKCLHGRTEANTGCRSPSEASRPGDGVRPEQAEFLNVTEQQESDEAPLKGTWHGADRSAARVEKVADHLSPC
jgi:hypothetical protein